MFLIIVLFGLLALGLAFVTYLQSDLNQSTPPKSAPPAIVAPAAPAAPVPTPEAAQLPADSKDTPTASPSSISSTSSTLAGSTASPAQIPQSQIDAADQLRAALKEAAEAMSKASAENKEPGAPEQP